MNEWYTADRLTSAYKDSVSKPHSPSAVELAQACLQADVPPSPRGRRSAPGVSRHLSASLVRLPYNVADVGMMGEQKRRGKTGSSVSPAAEAA